MTVHLLKLSVGSESVDTLRAFQARRLAQTGRLAHVTRHRPRRADEVLDGGSIYWIIKGYVRVRQRIIGLETVEGEDGITRCAILLDPETVETELQPRRPHQGWRYLEAETAPPDRTGGGTPADEPPPEMLEELRELGLI